MMTQRLVTDAAELLQQMRERKFLLATAESCTGGMIAAALTEIAGSSAVVDRGFVTYSNEAKMDLLNVPKDIIETHGAVSEVTARAMVAGALAKAPVDCAVAVTGIAGPGGGTDEKPVGLVHLAAARRDRHIIHERQVFPGDRAKVRHLTVLRALELLQKLLD